MSTPSLDRYADDFERLRALPLEQREAALAALPLSEDERATLRRLLSADSDADDPLARALADGAARFAAPRESRLGPYRLLRELGAGGMGTVFLAERVDGGFDQRVAIKLLRGFPTADGLRRLRQERQILAGLDHPHIARLLDGGETADGQPWLALEYVDGLDLLDYAAQRAPRLPDRLALFDAMLDAVGHAHQRLVVHRDLKPANVLVNAAGEVKLLDFGIARLIDLDSAAHETSTRVFSAGYASPEQRDGRTVTTASDIYSLGVLLRELVGGRTGHTARTPAALPLGSELAGIVAKATDQDPARRYAGAGEFRDDLDRYRNGRPVRAAPMTNAYRLRKFVGRHRLGVAASLLAALALGLFVVRLDRERERALAAEATAQQARDASERDAERARAALGFFTDAFTAAAPDNALSTTVSVRDLLDQARAKLDAQKLDAAVAQPTQRLLGRLYDSLGETSAAIELFRSGLDGAPARDRAEALALALDYDQYANLLGSSDRIDEAREAVHQASALRERYAPNDPDEQAYDRASLAFLHHNAGEDAKAIPLLKQVLEPRAAGAAPLPAPLAMRATQMLVSLLSNNDCEAALTVATRGLEEQAAGLAPNAPDRLQLLRLQAMAHRTCGRPAQAEQILRAVIAQQEQVTGSGGMSMLELGNELALTLKELGRFREAADVLQRLKTAGNESPYNQAVIFSNLALALDDAGDYTQALRVHAQARAALDRGGIEADSDARRGAARNEARTLAQAGQAERAVAMLEDLRARAGRIDGEDSYEYVMVTWQLALAERRARHVESSLSLTAQAERLWAALLPPEHKVFAHVHRQRAAIALMQNRLDLADSELTAAIAGFQASAATPAELATARSEQAEVRRRQGRSEEARTLLTAALPIMREAYLPTQVWRAEAERTATQLGVR